MSDPIDLIETSPGIYELKRENPHAYQWEVFWSSIRFLVVGLTVVVIIDQIVS